ncbi:MAG: hypothetical protein ABIO02_02340, partial [Patescibacteria group bacterium]
NIFLLHDERDIYLSAYSIAHSGKDLYGNVLPIAFDNISPKNPLLSIYYSSLWTFSPSNSVFMTRLPYVFISTFLIFLVHQFIYTLTKDKTKSLCTSLVFCFSPWIFHATRLALEPILAFVLLLSGMILFLNKKRYLAYLLLFLSMATYQANRVLVPVLILYIELFPFIKAELASKLQLKHIFTTLAFIVISFGILMSIDFKISQSRVQDTVFYLPKYSSQVELKRIQSGGPEVLKKIFVNKAVAAVETASLTLFKGFDPSYLFIKGDVSPINGNAVTGQFFPPFFIFFFLGLIAMGPKLKRVDMFFIGMLFISLLPSAVTGDTFALRSMLFAVGMAYILANGIVASGGYLQHLKKMQRYIVVGIFAIFFVTSLIYFSYGYFFQRPITIGELFNHSEQSFSTYAVQHSTKSYTVYTPSTRDLYLSLVYVDPHKDLSTIQTNLNQSLQGAQLQWNNYRFKVCDEKLNVIKEENIIVSEKCLKEGLLGEILTKKKYTQLVRYVGYGDPVAYIIKE